MTEFRIEELTRLLRECAGEDEAIGLDGDIMDTLFDDLGYDSLALFNTVSRIERDFRISLPDDTVAEAKTPRALLQEINACLSRSA
ncbi:acyl carrier protein [Amycolatopsis sp. NPDC054798]